MEALSVVTPPAEEPVSLAEAKVHLRIDHADEDELIIGWVRAARELAEGYCGRRWVTQRLRLELSAWPTACIGGVPAAVALPVEPVASVELVKYWDQGGAEVTLTAADYQTWLDHSPPLVCPPASAGYWPALQARRVKPVTIEFVAGAAAGAVPELLRAAVLLTIEHWDDRGGRKDQNVPRALGLSPGAVRLLDSLWTGSYR